jgi:hypothetical protein
MFELKLFDRNGIELKEGDIVKISNGREFIFYAEVKYLEDENIITPFHTFSFHSFVKVDNLPDNAIKCDENRYNIWYVENKEEDVQAKEYDKYLSMWRSCEHLLDSRIYRIIKK